MLRLAGTWIWDSGVAYDGERYHLFFLRARATPEQPEIRIDTTKMSAHEAADEIIEQLLRRGVLDGVLQPY